MLVQTYHNYLERYGDNEGKSNFISYCWFLIDSEIETFESISNELGELVEEIPFPLCLEVCEVIRNIKR